MLVMKSSVDATIARLDRVGTEPYFGVRHTRIVLGRYIFVSRYIEKNIAKRDSIQIFRRIGKRC